MMVMMISTRTIRENKAHNIHLSFEERTHWQTNQCLSSTLQEPPIRKPHEKQNECRGCDIHDPNKNSRPTCRWPTGPARHQNTASFWQCSSSHGSTRHCSAHRASDANCFISNQLPLLFVYYGFSTLRYIEGTSGGGGGGGVQRALASGVLTARQKLISRFSRRKLIGEKNRSYGRSQNWLHRWTNCMYYRWVKQIRLENRTGSWWSMFEENRRCTITCMTFLFIFFVRNSNNSI